MMTETENKKLVTELNAAFDKSKQSRSAGTLEKHWIKYRICFFTEQLREHDWECRWLDFAVQKGAVFHGEVTSAEETIYELI